MTSTFGPSVAFALLCASSGAAMAQAGDAAGGPSASESPTLQVEDPSKSAPTFFVGQRLWYATWNSTVLDTQIVTDPVTQVTRIENSMASSLSSNWMPVTSLGMRVGDVTAIASFFPKTTFDRGGPAGGQTRQEQDFALGYNLYPTLTASLIYKSGKVTSGTTLRTTQLLNVTATERGRGLIFGLNGQAPLDHNLSLYGNVAYGPSKWKIENAETYSGRYAIADLGLAYRLQTAGLLDAFKAVTLQMGFRSQMVEFKDVDIRTFSTTVPGQVLSNQKRDVVSTTYGLIFGISSAF